MAFTFYVSDMALTAAEKQRRYRARRDADNVRRAEYLQKEKGWWQRKKLTGATKSVKDMNDRELRKVRRYWKLSKVRNRKKKYEQMETLAKLATPPCSPATDEQQPSIQQVTGEKMRRKNRTKHLKELVHLEDKLGKQIRETAKYKKRWQRLFYRAHPESPRRKTMRLLRHACTMSMKKSLLFHNVLLDEIRRKYSATKQERTKQMYFRLLAGSMVKKYRLRSYMQTQIGFSAKRWSTFPNKINNCDVTYHRKKSVSLGVRFRQRVQDFYNRDDNSRMTTGKRDTVTEKKIKKQK